jgi:hypothetical protein
MPGPTIDQVTQAGVTFDELRATPGGLAWLERRPEFGGAVWWWGGMRPRVRLRI